MLLSIYYNIEKLKPILDKSPIDGLKPIKLKLTINLINFKKCSFFLLFRFFCFRILVILINP